ncbi:OmpA family protein [Kerstersia gyiorum]|uniref:Membrane protein n=1 Tax=Kerstersia gyiorum TaxID=206506 RepID=A0A171KQY7_9BURK|nr:OmpA family protein [Kerstersia gyiorum]MCO7640139.1 OmpA family protein [Pseudomonas sp. S 311-6]KAB0543227.1 OmpA family protein [Kerstersia gyiorum]KKO71304.1 membrane protein [Kerstersia gyiorum]MCP1632676.1 outer membrane protein OmpA-like peptidoglycan-associated protein [Kerstersia gyiorum]MCP1635793.1 outer membrane protein OmpA-like peptidoglycan-associated protein [Kerstersia gyiorum]
MKQGHNGKLAAAALAAILLAGCASQQQNNTLLGSGAGAALGAGVGALIGDSSKAALIGAGIGAVAGGVVGYNWGGIKQDVEQSGATGLGIDVTEQPNGTLKVNIPASAGFTSSSAALQPALLPVLDSVARALVQHPEVRAKVIGNTDNTGSAAYNQKLSVERAQSVSTYLQQRGVAPGDLTIEGRGFSDPVASNDTAEGRAANRRVEIYLYAVQQ